MGQLSIDNGIKMTIIKVLLIYLQIVQHSEVVEELIAACSVV